MREIKVRLTFTEEVLGSNPSDSSIYEEYIASNAPTKERTEEEMELAEGSEIGQALVEGLISGLSSKMAEDSEEKKPKTVFTRNEEGVPIIWDYQIKGFFKDTCGGLRKVPKTRSSKIKAYKKEIDKLVFVYPRQIPFVFDGDIGYCGRTLRASTPKGERTAIAFSETVPEGATIEFTVICLVDDYIDTIREWLDYGVYSGMGQWRNSGKGRFTWEEIE